MTPDELFSELERLEILSAIEISQLRSSLQEDPVGQSLDVVNRLIAENRLTSFQANRLLRGESQELILGNYLLLEMIGQGGMGQVFKATHRRMKRVVAIKLLPHRMTKSASAIDRFHREIQALAKLEHPNIVSAHDADEFQGRHFLVMQFVDGIDLSRLVYQRGPLSIREAISVLLQVARGLAYAHSRGVVHRDIKPANLLIEHTGVVKILDLGLAHISQGGDGTSDADTSPDEAMGTVDFMAPEQALADAHVDPRSDIYSLGCTLFFLLTGLPPYHGAAPLERLRCHRDGPIPDLKSLRSDLSADVIATFERMVARHPVDRYSSMHALAADIEQCAETLEQTSEPLAGVPTVDDRVGPTSTALPSQPDESRPPRRLRKPWRLTMGVLVAACAAFFTTRWAADSPEVSNAGALLDRQVAQWALDRGSLLEIFVGDRYEQVKSPITLPTDVIRHQGIEFYEGNDAVITAADVQRMAKLSSLTTLGLYDAEVAPDAWSQFPRLQNLKHLALGRTAVSDDDLQHICQLENVFHLRLGETNITDAGLEHLAAMTSLEDLDLKETRVTRSGVARLHEKLPRCRIDSSHGVLRP